MKKNDVITLEITDMTHDGKGIGHFEQQAVFVPRAVIGDVLEVHIVKVTKNISYGKIKKVIQSAPCRINSDCEAFTRCGGCTYRHIDYNAELKIKYNKIYNAMKKIGHIDLLPEGIVPSETDGYRNKIQHPFGYDKNGDICVGFFSQKSHNFIPVKQCRLYDSRINALLHEICAFFSGKDISVYSEKTQSGLLRHVYIRRSYSTGDIMLCFVINGSDLPDKKDLSTTLTKKHPEIKSIMLNINRENTNVILGRKYIKIYGEDFLQDELLGKKFMISPSSFYQVNPKQTEKLYSKAFEYINFTGNENVLDLYCGIGTIGLCAAGRVNSVTGVEIVEDAVINAKNNTRINRIDNAVFFCGDAGDIAAKIAQSGRHFDVIIVDPPRKGLDLKTINAILQMKPEKLLYISCNIATAARDTAILSKDGYTLQKYTGVDMFPRTEHVESVLLFVRE